MVRDGTSRGSASCPEWMRDNAYSEVLVGRVFVILGVKFAEMAMAPAQFSAERLLIEMQRTSNHSTNRRLDCPAHAEGRV